MASPAQFVEQSMLSGFQQGVQQHQQKQDEEHQLKIKDLLDQRDALVQKIPQLQQGTPEYEDAQKALQGVAGGIRELYHPDNHPQAIQKFGHLLTDRLGITKPQPTATMAVPKPQGLVEAGNLNIWNRPTVQNADGSHSTEYSTSFQDDNGHEVLVPTVVSGKFLTPDGKKPPEGSPAEKAMFKAAWDHYLKTGENLGKFANSKDADAYAQILHNRGSAPKSIVAQQSKQAALSAKDQAEVQRLQAAGPLSPEQQTNAQGREQLATVQNSLKMFDTLNPNATPEEKQDFRDQVTQHALGIAQKPTLKLYTLPDGTKAWLDATRPDLIPPGSTAAVTESATTLKHQQWLDFHKNNPDYKGTEIQWDAEQAAAGRPSTSAINEGRTDYAKSHGFPTWNDIPDEYRDKAMDYEIRKQAFDKAYPSSTTTTSLKQNFQGQWVPVTETNYKTPQGSETLHDPLWFLAKPVEPPKGATQPSSPASPKALKGEATKRAPKDTAESPKGTTKVGVPLFAAPSKEYNDAKSNYDAAVSRTKIMEKNLKNALATQDQQAMLSLVANHIGMTLGAQKGARINQAVWNEAVESTPWLDKVAAKFGPDGYLSGVTLAPNQMKQMVELAHERTDVSKDELDRITQQLNSGVTNPSGGSAPPPANGLPPGWK